MNWTEPARWPARRPSGQHPDDGTVWLKPAAVSRVLPAGGESCCPIGSALRQCTYSPDSTASIEKQRLAEGRLDVAGMTGAGRPSGHALRERQPS